MSSSPFSTFEEFSSAEGPIYTFASSPVMVAILLILSLLITLYFVYSSFFMTQDDLHKKLDAKALGLMVLAGFASVMGSVFSLHPQRSADVAKSRYAQEVRAEQPAWHPLAMLGLTGLGGAVSGRKSKRRRFYNYRSSRRSP